MFGCTFEADLGRDVGALDPLGFQIPQCFQGFAVRALGERNCRSACTEDKEHRVERLPS